MVQPLPARPSIAAIVFLGVCDVPQSLDATGTKPSLGLSPRHRRTLANQLFWEARKKRRDRFHRALFYGAVTVPGDRSSIVHAIARWTQPSDTDAESNPDSDATAANANTGARSTRDRHFAGAVLHAGATDAIAHAERCADDSRIRIATAIAFGRVNTNANASHIGYAGTDASHIRDSVTGTYASHIVDTITRTNKNTKKENLKRPQ